MKKDHENQAQDFSNIYLSEDIQEASTPNKNQDETLEEKFELERQAINVKIQKMNNDMRDIANCIGLMSDVLNERQRILEYSHMLSTKLVKLTIKIRGLRVERHVFYNNEYDIRLESKDRTMFIDNDLKTHVLLFEILNNHLKYLRDSLGTLDGMHYNIKQRISLEDFKRANM
jgi:hypothetical protein